MDGTSPSPKEKGAGTVISAARSLPEARSAFLLHRLIAEHAHALLAYADRLLRDRQTAEDIVQETMIRAWEHTDRLYGNHGSVRGWLLTVTRNLVIDEVRGARYRRETVGTDEYDAIETDHSDSVLASMQVKGLLRQLSQEHRDVLVHTYLRGKSIDETAEILGVPAGTVKSRQHYALKYLRIRATAGRR